MFAYIIGGLNTTPWSLGTGRSCRACGSPIQAGDGFGLSEGICPACRGDAEMDLAGRPYDRLGGGGRLAARAAAALGERASRSLAALRRAA